MGLVVGGMTGSRPSATTETDDLQSNVETLFRSHTRPEIYTTPSRTAIIMRWLYSLSLCLHRIELS